MERWWGFRPCTPDQAPLLGKGPIGGLWLATGHHRNGVLLAAISAELVAGALLGQQGNDGLLKAFQWSRFACSPPARPMEGCDAVGLSSQKPRRRGRKWISGPFPFIWPFRI
jgi:hypothetical protein